MAYAAVCKLRVVLEKLLFKFSPCFRPSCLKLLELAMKEMNSFEEFLNGLGVNTRKRMKASLGRIAEAICKFENELVQHVEDQDAEAEKPGFLISLEVESLKHEFHVIFYMMKEIKKERFNGDAEFGGNKPKMVGLTDLYNKIKKDTVFVEPQGGVQFMTLVGMAGIGKTTLVEAVFEDLDMVENFECRVWVFVGKHYQVQEILRRILAQLNPVSAQMFAEGNGDIRDYFEEILKEKRYFIVLDDVWDAAFCGYMKSILPEGRDGSRVFITSRSRRVVLDYGFFTDIRLLNEKESWVLLREKLFGEKSCSPELEKVGKKIAEKCDGLPLTIIAVADLLLKIPESQWIDVATQRKHQVFIDAYDEISKVLYPSYEDLPQQLKLCFLYMAVFRSNDKITRSRLINMWFVEELLESNADKSSEAFADDYLEEFSCNSIIMVYQKRINSPLFTSVQHIKSCGLHSSWWHLCYTEARKDNFLYVLSGREDRLGEDIKSQSRLSIHNNILFAIKEVYDSIEKNSASTACSLLCSGPYHRYPVPICFGLRFLKNLDALSIRLYEFPLVVLELGELKYFALTCDGELPASISKVHKLEFFIVRRHHNIKLLGAPSYLPVEIWDMIELKHFQIMGSDLPDDLCETILPNLSTLLDVSGRSCTKGIFERIPHLKKLGIRVELSLDSVEPFCFLDHISQLKKLEILKCVVVNPVVPKFEFASLPNSLSTFPFGLKKLTLSGLGFSWEEMSKIASLPCLDVLKLRCNAFRGPEWEVEENGFPKLRFIVIEDIDLMQWKVQIGSFKHLESISIKHCYKLKEVHWDCRVDLLERIEVVDSNPSIEKIIREALLRQRHIPEYFYVRSTWEEESVKP